jgi:hypothetical protein
MSGGLIHFPHMPSWIGQGKNFPLTKNGNKLTNLITNSMEYSTSWEANISSPAQEMRCIVWNSKVHYGT